MASKIDFLVFPEDEKLYVELQSFIEFLRDQDTEKAGDETYNRALLAVAEYLENKQQQLLADHILSTEAQDAKDKDRLN